MYFPHLDYGDIIYDRAYNELFHQKLESIQYNAALAITGALWGTSRAKLYQDLGLESLQKRRWYRKLCYFFKIFKGQSPDYLSKILPGIITQEMLITFPVSIPDTIFSGILFSHQL